MKYYIHESRDVAFVWAHGNEWYLYTKNGKRLVYWDFKVRPPNCIEIPEDEARIFITKLMMQ